MAQQEQRLRELVSSQQQELANLRTEVTSIRTSLNIAHEKANCNLLLTVLGAFVVLPPAFVFWKILG